MAFFDNPYDEDVSGLADGWDSPLLVDRQIAEDASGLTDDLVSPIHFFRAISESAPTFANFNEGLGFSFSSRTFEVDISGQTDAVVRALVMSRAVPESGTAADSIVEAKSFTRSVAESAGSPASSWTEMVKFVRALAQTASASDAFASQQMFARPLSEATSAADSLVRHTVFGRNLAQTVSGSDALNEVVLFVRPSAETASASDSFLRQMVMVRPSSESVSGSASLEDMRIFSRPIAEDGSLSDVTLAGVNIYHRSASESVSGLAGVLAQALTYSRVIGVTLTEPSADFARNQIFVATFTEDASVTSDFTGLILTTTLPPAVVITDITRFRSSHGEGVDGSMVTFEFSIPVDHWVARLRSHGPFDGTLVDEHSGSVVMGGTAFFPSSKMLNGENTMMIYGRSVKGVWSREMEQG